MKTTGKKLVALLMTAVLIVCLAAGCSGKSSAPADTTPASQATQAPSAEAPASQSTPEPSAEAPTESTPEPAAETPSPEPTPEPTPEPEPFVGSWVYKDGDELTHLTINADETALYQYEDGSEKEGEWQIEGQAIAVYTGTGGTDYTYNPDTDRLRTAMKGDKVFFRDGSELPDRNSDEIDPVGLWEYTGASESIELEIQEDNNAVIKYSDSSEINAKWHLLTKKVLRVETAEKFWCFTYDSELCSMMDYYFDQEFFKK